MKIQQVTKSCITLCILSWLITNHPDVIAQTGKPRWQPIESGVSVSFRGMDVVSDSIIWVSGSNSTVLRTTDGGQQWVADTVRSGIRLDFRDVHAFGSGTAYIMSAGPGEQSRIYKTVDGGETWQLLFTNPHEKGFFNSMAFWDERRGMVVSDPVDDKLLILFSEDAGKSWQRIARESLPPVQKGEYGFAASGSNISLRGENIWICTGGAAARIFHSGDRGETWWVFDTPMIQGSPSAGIFSMAFWDKITGIIVGGDYQKPDSVATNVAITQDGGKTWEGIEGVLPYRSCVAYVPQSGGKTLVAVGTSGSDYSSDGGRTWSRIDTIGYHTLDFSPSGVGWAAGADGGLAKLLWKPE